MGALPLIYKTDSLRRHSERSGALTEKHSIAVSHGRLDTGFWVLCLGFYSELYFMIM